MKRTQSQVERVNANRNRVRVRVRASRTPEALGMDRCDVIIYRNSVWFVCFYVSRVDFVVFFVVAALQSFSGKYAWWASAPPIPFHDKCVYSNFQAQPKIYGSESIWRAEKQTFWNVTIEARLKKNSDNNISKQQKQKVKLCSIHLTWFSAIIPFSLPKFMLFCVYFKGSLFVVVGVVVAAAYCAWVHFLDVRNYHIFGFLSFITGHILLCDRAKKKCSRKVERWHACFLSVLSIQVIFKKKRGEKKSPRTQKLGENVNINVLRSEGW